MRYGFRQLPLLPEMHSELKAAVTTYYRHITTSLLINLVMIN